MKERKKNRTKIPAFLLALLLVTAIPAAAIRETTAFAQIGTEAILSSETGIKMASSGGTGSGTASSGESGAEAVSSGEGIISSKEEVIYAKLGVDGSVRDIYAVNILNVSKSGIVSDWGSYSSVKNLTSAESIDYSDETATVAAAVGRFYYQGDMTDKALPWNITITYTLDSKPITAEELAGASGRLELRINTSRNTVTDESFYNNYLLQVTVTLDTSRYTDLTADGATLANAGTDKLITFTVMPKKEGSLLVQAGVMDFAMEGIQFSAVPFSMNVDLPDTSGFTQDLTLLSDAVTRLTDGIRDLSVGLDTVKDGAQTLSAGSGAYGKGINTLDNGAKDLTNASASIHSALTLLSSSLKAALNGRDLSGLGKLPATLTQLSDGLKELSTGLSDLSAGYSAAYTALAASISKIPDQPLSAEDLQKLIAEHPGDAVISTLAEVYTAAQTVRATYREISPVLDVAGTNLATAAVSIRTIAGSLDQVAAGLTGTTSGTRGTGIGNTDLAVALSQLTNAVAALEANYGKFDEGLNEFTDGVSALASSYADLDDGISGLYQGISGISGGMAEISSGARELDDKTEDIPDQISSTIGELLADYDTSDFRPVSFVSPENQKVSSVQFVLKTEDIKKPELTEAKTGTDDKENIWTRFLDLFR